MNLTRTMGAGCGMSKGVGLMSSLLLLSSSLVTAAPSAIEVWAAMQVEGYTYEAAHRAPTRTNSYSFRARCIVSRRSWFMENHAPKNAIRYLYCDGTNTCSTFEYLEDYDPTTASAMQKRMGLVGGRVPGLPAAIEVVPSLHPLDDLAINGPWMAYCSAAFLDQPERRIPLPGPWHIRHSPYAFGYSDRTVRYDDALGLPRSIELYASTRLMRESPHRPLLIRNDKMTSVRAPFLTPVPFDENELHCRYVTIESTNVLGWHIPLHFTLVLEPHRQEGRLVGLKVDGRTDRIALVDEVPTLPSPAGRATVTDLRVREAGKLVDAVVYGITNESIPATNDWRITQALAAVGRRAPTDPVPGVRRRMVLFYFAIIVLAGLTLWVVRQGRRQKGRAATINTR